MLFSLKPSEMYHVDPSLIEEDVHPADQFDESYKMDDRQFNHLGNISFVEAIRKQFHTLCIARDIYNDLLKPQRKNPMRPVGRKQMRRIMQTSATMTILRIKLETCDLDRLGRLAAQYLDSSPHEWSVHFLQEIHLTGWCVKNSEVARWLAKLDSLLVLMGKQAEPGCVFITHTTEHHDRSNGVKTKDDTLVGEKTHGVEAPINTDAGGADQRYSDIPEFFSPNGSDNPTPDEQELVTMDRDLICADPHRLWFDVTFAKKCLLEMMTAPDGIYYKETLYLLPDKSWLLINDGTSVGKRANWTKLTDEDALELLSKIKAVPHDLIRSLNMGFPPDNSKLTPKNTPSNSVVAGLSGDGVPDPATAPAAPLCFVGNDGKMATSEEVERVQAALERLPKLDDGSDPPWRAVRKEAKMKQDRCLLALRELEFRRKYNGFVHGPKTRILQG